MTIRKGLHARGYRYRLHPRKLPGRPDLILPRYNVAIFVNGCFWHGHKCQLFRWPETRKTFWKKKILGNIERDKIKLSQLSDLGWRVMVIWECSLKGKNRLAVPDVLNSAEDFIISSDMHSIEISGDQLALN